MGASETILPERIDGRSGSSPRRPPATGAISTPGAVSDGATPTAPHSCTWTGTSPVHRLLPLWGRGVAMLRLAGTFALVLLLLSSVTNAGKRVALVVGNGAYAHAAALVNPVNDAADVAAALKKAGVEVVHAADLDKARFDRKIREVAAALTGAEAGIFFYAGHGLQVAGKNYLVPIDAAPTAPRRTAAGSGTSPSRRPPTAGAATRRRASPAAGCRPARPARAASRAASSR